MATQSSVVCPFCLKESAKYTCPRCNRRYCSIECYKCEGHAECSESFYRDCFMDGLREMKGTAEDRKKVKDILRRTYDEQHLEGDQEDTDDQPDLAERLEGLDLDGVDSDTMWSRLTAHEKAEFQAMIKDGRMGSLLKKWTAWWTCHVKVEELGEDYEPDRGKVPSVLDGIKDIGELLKQKEPSCDIKNNVVNILFGYAYLCRFYNGEIHENASSFSRDLCHLCGSFKAEVYKSSSDAVHTLLAAAQADASLRASTSFSVTVLVDTLEIISGPMANSLDYVLAALSDIHRVLCAAQLETKAVSSPKSSDREKKGMKRNRQTLFASKMKLEFLLSWVKALGQELSVSVLELEKVHCELSSELVAQKQAEQVQKLLKGHNMEIQQGKVQKPLIEELN